MNQENRIRLSWYSICPVVFLYINFGFGKLIEQGPPNDDPLGGSDRIFEYAQIASITLGFSLFLGMFGFSKYY